MKVNSKEYWEQRYKKRGNSGAGSYDNLCLFKTQIINKYIHDNNVKTVGEFGCGDGNQLRGFIVDEYTGYDVSNFIIERNKIIFRDDRSKLFFLLEHYKDKKFDMTLSLDVIFHLVEDKVFYNYMELLFSASEKYVIIYSSNGEKLKETPSHMLDRNFTEWIEERQKKFKLTEKIKNKYPYNPKDPKNTSISDFYIYKKQS